MSDALETSVPGTFAPGNCNGRSAFTHTAYNEYAIIAGNLLARRPARIRPAVSKLTSTLLGDLNPA